MLGRRKSFIQLPGKGNPALAAAEGTLYRRNGLLPRGTGTVTLAAHYAGVTGTWHTWVGSNPVGWEFESPHPCSMPGRLTAGLLTLDQAIEVRILAGQLTPPRTAAAPPSYGG